MIKILTFTIGKELDEETGLYYYGSRYYNAQLARFHTVDNFSEKYYDFTPYQYAANNPVRNIDVNGDSIFDKGYLVNVNINKKNGTATYTGANGDPVSENFINNGAVLINEMVKTEEGVEAVEFMSSVATEINIFVNEGSNSSGHLSDFNPAIDLR